MEQYEAEQSLLLKEAQLFLSRTREETDIDRMIFRMCRLKDELAMLKKDVVETYQKTNENFEVGRDVVNRYLKGDKGTNKYIRELRAMLGG